MSLPINTAKPVALPVQGIQCTLLTNSGPPTMSHTVPESHPDALPEPGS